MLSISRTNTICDIAMAALCIIMLILVKISKPRQTEMAYMVQGGFILSLVTILTHLFMYYLVSYPKLWNSHLFNASYSLYILLYTLLLNHLFFYINQLSYKRRVQKDKTILMMNIFSIFYLAIMFYPMFSGKLYYLENNIPKLTPWISIFVVCGMIDAIFCMIAALTNKDSYSNIIFTATMMFIPMDFIALTCQLFFQDSSFASTTYVIPFTLLYILFHSNKYDEVLGCQNMDALSARLDDAIAGNKKFMLIYVTYPQIVMRDLGKQKETVSIGSSLICREIERLGKKVTIYSNNLSTYTAYCCIENIAEEELIIGQIQNILQKPVMYNGELTNAFYKMFAIRSDTVWDNESQISAVLGYAIMKFSNDPRTEFFDYGQEEIAAFKKSYFIEQQLMNIRNEKNLDDPRIICFAQPIYNNKTQSFRNAECLMRLKIGEELYYPDMFIPIAERTNCIHFLTLIILNKVCKAVKDLSLFSDFDALSVNFSTMDLDNRNIYIEVLDIIHNNGISPTKIRIEITESTNISDYDNILFNMQKLNAEGIQFYLDDFGTGYSNLGRIAAFPFKTIKFDKSILYRAISSKKAEKLVDLLVEFFKSNDFNVLVEGVENQPQNNFALERGFDYIQGYMYSQPVPIGRLIEFFDKA